jgi:response regulator RpfG family c-di-GMP phosphodiesterase
VESSPSLKDTDKYLYVEYLKQINSTNIKNLVYIEDEDIQKLLFTNMFDIVKTQNKIYKNINLKIFNPIAGLKYILHNSVDAIILDYYMPNLTALDFLSIIKFHDKLKHIPTFILSSIDKNNTLEILNLSMYSEEILISKPIDIEKLKFILNKSFQLI